MKKWLIIFCLIAFPVFAQKISNETFSKNNPNLIYDNEPRTFNGGSFVYIQGISDKPQPKTWMDKVKVRLFGSMEIPSRPDAPHLDDKSSFKDPSETEVGVQTQNFFGTKKEIKYISHTSNWNFIIQPMDSNTVSVQENIQFLLTEDMQIIRSWPTPKDKISLIKAEIDGHPILPDNNEKKALLNFYTQPAGLHKITLHYTLSIPTHGDFILPLIEGTWPLVTDRFSGVILNGKIALNDSQFLLGENLQQVPKNFTFQLDKQGNIFFQNTHILPAFTQIQLFANSSDIAPQQDEIQPFSISPFLFLCVAFFIIILYLILSSYEIHYASLTYLLKRFRHIGKNPFTRWLYRMGEVVIGNLILLFLIFIIASLLHIALSYIYWILLILIAIVAIICSDIFVFYPKQKMIYQLHQNKGEQ